MLLLDTMRPDTSTVLPVAIKYLVDNPLETTTMMLVLVSIMMRNRIQNEHACYRLPISAAMSPFLVMCVANLLLTSLYCHDCNGF